jgi:hypothetical protein
MDSVNTLQIRAYIHCFLFTGTAVFVQDIDRVQNGQQNVAESNTESRPMAYESFVFGV